MKKVITAIAICALLALTACGKEQIEGKGLAKQEKRDVADFSSITINGNYSIQGSIGSPQQFVISTNENLLPFISTPVSSGVLSVETKSGTELHPNVKQSIWFTVKDFNALTMTGTSQFQMANIDTDTLKLTLTGSHKLFIAGKASELTITINGNTSIDARNLIAENVTVVINGSSQVLLDADKKLNVTINGNGKVIYFNGQPMIEQTINGSGQVINGTTRTITK